VKKGMSLVLTFVLIAGLLLGSGVQAEVWAAPPIVVLNTPATPTGLTATVISSTQINLSWGSITEATGYELFRDGISIYKDVSTNFQDTGLTPNTTYNYKVRSYVINTGETFSADSLSVSAVTLTEPVPLPGAPQNLSAVAKSSSAIDLNWTAGTGSADEFYIERKISGGNFAVIANLKSSSATSYSDSGLNGNTTYYYRVRSSNGSGFSPYSNEANAATQPVVTVPARPTELKSTSVTNNQIVISWKDNSDNETAFIIERKIENGNFSQLAEKSANTTSHTDSGLSANTTYTYRVMAKNAAGNSAYSNELPVTTTGIPAKPTELRTTSVSNTQIVIAWKDNSNNETGFRIERKVGNGNFSTLTTTGANVTSFTNSGLTNNTVYTYRVRAVNAAGESDPSNELRVTTGTVPAKPETLKVTATGTDRITLSWTDKSNNEKGFRIERKTGSGSFIRDHNGGCQRNQFYQYRVIQ
jgi:uncharacterized protein